MWEDETMRGKMCQADRELAIRNLFVENAYIKNNFRVAKPSFGLIFSINFISEDSHLL